MDFEWFLLLFLVPKLCPTLYDPMDYRMPGFLVLHFLLKFLKLISFELIMPSNHLILRLPLLLLPSIFLSIRVFSNESALHIRWPEYWSFSINPSNKYSGLISFRTDWLISLQSKGLSRVFPSTTTWKHQFLMVTKSLISQKSMDAMKYEWFNFLCLGFGICIH